MTAAVDVDHVSKSFRVYRDRNQSIKQTLLSGRRAVYDRFEALKDVSFEVPEGSTFGLIGPEISVRAPSGHVTARPSTRRAPPSPKCATGSIWQR